MGHRVTHQVCITRRLIVVALGLIVISVGLYFLLTAASWKVSNSRWEKAGFPWIIEHVDPESSAGKMFAGAARKTNTDALIVIKSGRIVFEYYSGLPVTRAGKWLSSFQGPNRLYGTASMAKSLVGSMALLVAVSDGLVRLDDPVARYIEGWDDESVRSKITVGQLASHSSGIPHGQKIGRDRSQWEVAFWSNRPDLFERVIKDVRPIFEPGTGYLYSGPAWAVLGYVVTRAIGTTTSGNVRTLLSERVMKPIGVPDTEWRIGYGKVFNADGMELYAMWGGGRYTARAVARLGQLMLSRGIWDGAELVSSIAVDEILSYAAVRNPVLKNRPVPVAGWWSNNNGALQSLSCAAYIAAGVDHQILIVVPNEDLIIVRFGRKMGRDRWEGDYWDALDLQLLVPMVRSGFLKTKRSLGNCAS